ncbi:MAG: nucleotidyltransferase family protein [Armatimonadota bacterium]
MKAVILAAGKGTRLGSLTRNIPKAMVDIAGKPAIEHIISYILHCGIKDFIIVTRYLADKLESYLGSGKRLSINISYARQGEKYGTGAALYTAKELVGNEPFMMTFADIITGAHNYDSVFKLFSQKGGAGVVTCNWVDDPFSGASVIIDDEKDKITKIIEKPPKGNVISHWNSSGLFVFEPIIFDYLAQIQVSERGEYELVDALNMMIEENLDLYPCYLKGAWRDIGRVEDISAAERIVLRKDF